MPRKLDFISKGLIGFFAICLLCALWASAQTNSGISTLEFARSVFTVRENSRKATITIKRAGNTNTSCSVAFATQDGNAKDGVDYVGVSGPVLFSPGQVEESVVVPIIDNFEVDGRRKVKLALNNPTGGAVLGAVSIAELEIEDNDVKQAAWVSFGLNRVPVLQRTAFGIPLWQ